MVKGDYTDWRVIDYDPVVEVFLPEALVPHLTKGQTCLDIGCDKGNASMFLARQGFDVTGIDINPKAIEIASDGAKGLEGGPHFQVADVLEDHRLGEFDAVLMIRLLTCFPALDHWRRLLKKTQSLIKDGGLLYINDFLLTEDNSIYLERYNAARNKGMRYGNFEVFDESGCLQFIAHHHTPEEMTEIMSPCKEIKLKEYTSYSMYGNDVNMFEFIGRKVIQ
jgi:cyclopropane fatty-acyl-phospholipid synthase-like methyltransferase